MAQVYKTDFKGVRNIGDTQFMNMLEINLKTWMDWAFLRIGGWFDATVPSPGISGGDFTNLRLVDDPNYTAGQVWETARKDWVWESGVDYVNPDNMTTYNPINPVTTITVNGGGAPAHHINYPLGRIIFDTAIATTSTVVAEYSYRFVQVYIASQATWWQELQYRSFRPDDSYFTQTTDGDWSIGGQHRVQMPCVIIESVPRTASRGFQLGDGAAWVEQDVLCHVIAENRHDRNNICDTLLRQFDQTIRLFDVDAVAAAGDAPLDYRGEIVDNTKTYTSLISLHPWELCRFIRTQSSEVATLNPKLYEGVVRLTCESVLDD